MRSSRVYRRRSVQLLTVAALLLLGLSGGLVGAQPVQEGAMLASAENDFVTCTATSSSLTTCTVKVVADQFTLDLTDDLLTVAQEINSAIDEDTVLWIQAYGGRGGNATGSDSGDGGDGGFARTVTSISDFKSINNQSTISYWIGPEGKETDFNSADASATYGGIATLVLLDAQPSSIDDVILIAGGGGAGSLGDPVTLTDGPGGKAGGVAVATGSSDVVGKGGWSGNPPGDDNGIFGGSNSGAGVGGGRNVSDCGNCTGIGWSGIGGKSCDTDDKTTWMNSDQHDPGVGDDGMGGFPTADTVTGIVFGGCAGGGYGGGQGGVFQNTLVVDGEIVANGYQYGSGGGGSYAIGATRYDALAALEESSSGNGSVEFVFNTSPLDVYYDTPTANEYGVNPVSSHSSPAFVDIDDDGDLDFFTGDGNGKIYYRENIGSTSSPQFQTDATLDPFGINSVDGYSAPTFVDINDDGKMDFFTGDDNGKIYYRENIGTVSSPEFENSATLDPFGINSVEAYSTPTFVDIDDDGDFDFFTGDGNGKIYYRQNIGTASSPEFQSDATLDPFGLDNVSSNSHPTFIDIDGDGDFDFFTGDGNGKIYFRENLGSATDPKFQAKAILDPMGLESTNGHSVPKFGIQVKSDGTTLYLTPGGPDAVVGGYSGNYWFYPYSTLTTPPLSGAVMAAAGLEGLTGDGQEPADPSVDFPIINADQIVGVVYGSDTFDASQVNQDITSLVDWNRESIATPVQFFFGSALGDLNGDGYPDRSLIFYRPDNGLLPPLTVVIEGWQELCISGVTLDGVRFEGCKLVDQE